MNPPTSKKHALVLLIKEIMSQIDEIAALKAKGGSAAVSEKMLQEMCSVLQDLDPELLDLYYEWLPTLTANSTAARKPEYTKEYVEASQGPKERLILELQKKLKSVG